jgi:hypothetical protein
MYSTFFMYGYQVMRGVIEEKSNRIVEIIVASVRPVELMVGKIVGIGLVGLTQYLVWSLVAMNLSLPAFAGMMSGGDLGVPRIPVSMLGYFILFFSDTSASVCDDRRAVQHGPGSAAAGHDSDDHDRRRHRGLSGRHEQPTGSVALFFTLPLHRVAHHVPAHSGLKTALWRSACAI